MALDSARSGPAQSGASTGTSTPPQLKKGALGLVGVVFMVVAFSAPVTAMTGNLPVAVGFGNGIGAPAGFIIATIVLTIFSVGFIALARHITAAGAFYTFVSRGWSRIVGLPAGVLSMFTYMTMEAALIGIFSAFAQQAVESQFGLDLPWIVYGAACLVVIAVLSHKDISLAAKVLGLVLVLEIALLTATAVSSLVNAPEGLSLTSLNPATALSTNGVPGGVVGLGLLMAFWSWVGFESTAIYGEESKDPKRIVPQATLIAVIGIGVFYTFISWGVIAGNGGAKSVELASGAEPFDLIYAPSEMYLGAWSVHAYQWLAIGGSFACALAIHNSAARYLFAFGRDRILPNKLGAVHETHNSPWIASLTQSCFAGILLLGCVISGSDPYGVMFVLIGIMATLSLLAVQVMCSISTIVYFHVRGEHPETKHWLRTLVCPVIGALGMLFVIYLMASNMRAAAGAASETLLFKAIPYILIVLFVASLVTALYLRRSHPAVYQRIGSTIFDDLPAMDSHVLDDDPDPDHRTGTLGKP
ncbi:APC family permease [Gordonia paraffinivorans]|uniref:APC family permease n=1 Tax=Gordonia paraffinivorans TaxID=175628 RepID=UPI001445D339|nr:APC family permease [Gordonia paraffinivorans]